MSTIGVALAIPEPWASELQDYRKAVGDHTAAMIPTHITLVPPTEIDPGQAAEVERHLEDVAAGADPFRVHLRGTGTFRPVSPVVFVTLVEGISRCEQLAKALRRGPLDAELQYPYHPHVTIAHHLGDDLLDQAFEELAGFECQFEAERFHLYVHDDRTGWRPTRDFPLQAGNQTPPRGV
ncbi:MULTISPECIES: 2'-5' RNA ligase family protein [unclassified Nocardioides]|uniref:2'-5' RNA ligase family protein n=1 Tax=unclassified Nocardioides TaxID=2615069 RepID=UPI0000570ADA|nr:MULTISPECIES: 2'-5' RNA ligase family protein [unclassified Nocardioides]ABL83056.1 2',5' RNA ligase [Nocardioides sp. JS614]